MIFLHSIDQTVFIQFVDMTNEQWSGSIWGKASPTPVRNRFLLKVSTPASLLLAR